MAAGRRLDLNARLVPDALASLQAGDGNGHDAAIAADAAKLPECDAIVLGQFSMARACDAVRAGTACPVLTTPDSAVVKLKRLLGG
jgi:hypothetical protein